jgi:hypothetical protein
LQLELMDNCILRVQPGIAVAPSGRVLQLSGAGLIINLQDSGAIADRNKGRYRRFNRGLYAVALKYAEVIDSVGEAYPADLAGRRRMQAGCYAEGVELALIPLNLTLPSGDSLAVRAALAQQLIGRGSRFDLATDEAIALGLIAIDDARPLWLDRGLLRRPLRPPTVGNALQLDLAAHYHELFDEVVAARRAGGRQNDFSAASYFRLLPPFGPLPRGAIDPVGGRQSYFPGDYDVTIAPVRRADLPAIIEESAHLAPMDLERDADADIMVLVPLSDQAFALRARQLENQPLLEKDAVTRRLPLTNGLALRLFSRPPAHLIDTDAAAWKAIWDEADPDELVYVRRPPRTAETNVSAVVLARGFTLPLVTAGVPPDPAALEAGLDTALEENISLKAACEQKKSEITVLQKEIEGLKRTLGSDIELNEALVRIQKLEAALDVAGNEIKELIPGAHDAVVFKTALEAATDKITHISVELEQTYKKIAELQSTVPADATARKKIEELTAALNEAAIREAARTSERDELQKRLTEAELRLKTLYVELEKLKKKVDDSGVSMATGDAALVAAREEIARKNLLIEQYTAQQKVLDADLVKARKAQSLAEEERSNALQRQADAQIMLQTVQTEKNIREMELKQNQEQMAALQSQLDNAEKKNAEYLAQMAQRVSLRIALPLAELAKMRGADTADAEKLEQVVGDNVAARLAVVQLLALVPAAFDKALWPSLVSVAKEPRNLPKLRGLLLESMGQGLTAGQAFLERGESLGVSSADLSLWKKPDV